MTNAGSKKTGRFVSHATAKRRPASVNVEHPERRIPQKLAKALVAEVEEYLDRPTPERRERLRGLLRLIERD